jgi:hypothetical protein
MKRILLAMAAVAALAAMAFGASFDVDLAWDRNTEPDMKEYKIYRTDGARAPAGTVNHPTTSIKISVTIPDGTEGAVKFVATAVDQVGNESGDSNEVSRPFDYRAPDAPANFR